ncbi:unnamed protein product [Bursaphelenchus xylophilus]|uniref:(pine wood nematode) hypothetical protein n=1 Tax=Bursaphelenchus xylophilus TaxID=6326 RepID=A0A1I7RMZ2_BURXY|nr:unnamed protein product [Bursaphelenchus xylophilus]CAG9125330.1 unnamed protein product [Bursaphelenchus xylophilus]
MAEGLEAFARDIGHATALLVGIGVIGIVGNLNILWATCRKRSLRSTCNIFIAIAALADVFQQFGNLAMGCTVFSGNVLIPVETCFKLQVMSTFGCTVSSFMLFMTAVDRMVCVVFPRHYKLSCNSIILPIGVIVSLSVASLFSVTSYFLMDPGFRICGALMDLPWTLAPYFFVLTVSLICSTVVLYAIVWIAVRRRNYKQSKQMLKSITAVSICICGGWLATMGLGLLFNTFHLSSSYATALYIGALLNISISLNCPLLYFMSHDYKLAFKEQFRLLTCNATFVITKTRESQVTAYSGR